MASYAPIACSDYDILEIVCMDRYEIEVQYDTGTVLGIADGLDIRDGKEFLRVRCFDSDASTTSAEIRADRIYQITVLSRPARFIQHRFASVDDTQP